MVRIHEITSEHGTSSCISTGFEYYLAQSSPWLAGYDKCRVTVLLARFSQLVRRVCDVYISTKSYVQVTGSSRQPHEDGFIAAPAKVIQEERPVDLLEGIRRAGRVLGLCHRLAHLRILPSAGGPFLRPVRVYFYYNGVSIVHHISRLSM